MDTQSNEASRISYSASHQPSPVDSDASFSDGDEDEKLMAEIGADRLTQDLSDNSDEEPSPRGAKFTSRHGRSPGSLARAGRSYERREVLALTRTVVRDLAARPARRWSVKKKPMRTIGGGQFFAPVWRREDTDADKKGEARLQREEKMHRRIAKAHKKYSRKMRKLKGQLLGPLDGAASKDFSDLSQYSPSSNPRSQNNPENQQTPSVSRKENRSSRSTAESEMSPENARELTDKPHAAKIFKCPMSSCSKRFSTRGKVKAHVKKAHLGKLLYTCPKPACDERFPTVDDLKRHLSNHPKIEPEKVT